MRIVPRTDRQPAEIPDMLLRYICIVVAYNRACVRKFISVIINQPCDQLPSLTILHVGVVP